MNDIRIGHGYDVHRLCQDRRLVIGGVDIPYSLGLLGHSDADVLTHAVIDALLGAAGLGDIGKHFPDNDNAYLNADSIGLAVSTASLIKKNGWYIGNVDATVIAQKPKFAPYIDSMRENLSKALGITTDRVNIKATTEEKLGFTGREEGISAHCVCIIFKQ